MIIFKKIKWRNFLSTGNQFTEIDLTEVKTSLIIGTNGAGKSTILDALTFSLFNKPFRKVNKAQLVNTVNEKECVVEIEFSVGKTDWKVIRGIKPNIFEIYRDGNILDQNAAATDQQKWLEEQVLKLNYKSFTQIVILGSASFVPFMQLTASNRREVIEDLLDIKIFSVMGLILKERMRSTNERLRDISIRKNLLEEKVDMQNSFIQELEESGKKNIKEKKNKLKEINKDIDRYEGDLQELSEDLGVINQDIQMFSDCNAKLRKLGNLRGKLSQKVSTITKEHKFFTDNTVCPTCTQSLNEDFRVNRINDAETRAKKLQDGFKELEEAIRLEEEKETQFKELSQEASKLTHEISKTSTRISGLQSQGRDLEQEIQRVTDQIKNRTSERHALDKLIGELEGLQVDQSK